MSTPEAVQAVDAEVAKAAEKQRQVAEDNARNARWWRRAGRAVLVLIALAAVGSLIIAAVYGNIGLSRDNSIIRQLQVSSTHNKATIAAEAKDAALLQKEYNILAAATSKQAQAPSAANLVTIVGCVVATSNHNTDVVRGIVPPRPIPPDCPPTIAATP